MYSGGGVKHNEYEQVQWRTLIHNAKTVEHWEIQREGKDADGDVL